MTKRILDWVTVALPVALLALLVTTYLIDPRFYLTYVLEFSQRETQVVEIITFACLLLAGLLLVAPTFRLLRSNDRGKWLTIGIVGSLCLAGFFVAGEEIDWGDSYGLWGDEAPKGDAPALNLHNSSPLPIKSVGNLYLAGIFFGLPALWAFRGKLNLPAVLAPPVVPSIPVVIAMGIAFGWRFLKNVYRMFYEEGPRPDDPAGSFYWGFIEQINEHKEMLIAVALVFYALYHHLPRQHAPEQA
ncbi:MAG: hypothetical protein AAGD32_13125 [Planctomycetota bacterium]